MLWETFLMARKWIFHTENFEISNDTKGYTGQPSLGKKSCRWARGGVGSCATTVGRRKLRFGAVDLKENKKIIIIIITIIINLFTVG